MAGNTTSIFCGIPHPTNSITRTNPTDKAVLGGDQTYPNTPIGSIQTARVTVGLTRSGHRFAFVLPALIALLAGCGSERVKAACIEDGGIWIDRADSGPDWSAFPPGCYRPEEIPADTGPSIVVTDTLRGSR